MSGCFFFFFWEEWFGGITLRRSLLEIELSLFESCLFLIKFTFAGCARFQNLELRCCGKVFYKINVWEFSSHPSHGVHVRQLGVDQYNHKLKRLDGVYWLGKTS